MGEVLYDKNNVFFEWNENLEGKTGILCDSVEVLKLVLAGKRPPENCSFDICSVGQGNRDYPFLGNTERHKFFYFDEGVAFYPLMTKMLWDGQFLFDSWSPALTGKKVFLEDTVEKLREEVCQCEDPAKHNVSEGPNGEFVSNGKYRWRYAYYDPTYHIKKAWIKGKRIQRRESGVIDGGWVDCKFKASDVLWCYTWYKSYEWRVDDRTAYLEGEITNRHLAMWLAKGNGECRSGADISTSFSYPYDDSDGSSKVDDGIFVRRWGDAEWHKPDSEYCRIEKGE